jgi:hypothetical protein
MQQFGRDRVESGHGADIVDLSKMTHSGHKTHLRASRRTLDANRITPATNRITFADELETLATFESADLPTYFQSTAALRSRAGPPTA